MAKLFARVAGRISAVSGHYLTFLVALGLIVVWALSGPLFGFSETWQLVINTGTTIVTFLMVFLIQATQNRESKAIQLKLDELIRSSTARNRFADLEDATEEELDQLQHEFEEVRKQRD